MDKSTIKQMIAGIIITLGIFGIGFAVGYEFCWEKYNSTELVQPANITFESIDISPTQYKVIKNETMEYKNFYRK